MTKVVCSHGFGVRGDGRGMFTDIARALPEHQFTMFDYNTVDDAGDMFVAPLPVQAEILESQIEQLHDKVTLLCHSQGCIVASMADLKNVERVIFLAPPAELNIEKFMNKFSFRPGSHFDPAGVSRLLRKDGTTTYIDQEYVKSIDGVDVQELYTSLSHHHKLIIIRATHDEILGETDFSYLSEKAEIIDIDAEHNFVDTSRRALIEKLKDILKS